MYNRNLETVLVMSKTPCFEHFVPVYGSPLWSLVGKYIYSVFMLHGVSVFVRYGMYLT